jgi:hypothetical protein
MTTEEKIYSINELKTIIESENLTYFMDKNKYSSLLFVYLNSINEKGDPMIFHLKWKNIDFIKFIFKNEKINLKVINEKNKKNILHHYFSDITYALIRKNLIFKTLIEISIPINIIEELLNERDNNSKTPLDYIDFSDFRHLKYILTKCSINLHEFDNDRSFFWERFFELDDSNNVSIQKYFFEKNSPVYYPDILDDLFKQENILKIIKLFDLELNGKENQEQLIGKLNISFLKFKTNWKMAFEFSCFFLLCNDYYKLIDTNPPISNLNNLVNFVKKNKYILPLEILIKIFCIVKKYDTHILRYDFISISIKRLLIQ